MKANLLLLRAADAGDIGAMRAAIAEGADDLDHALIQASARGHAVAVGYLLDAGADIRAVSKLGFARGGERLSHNDALSEAALNGHCEVVRLLLERGAAPDARGNFALRCAAQGGHIESARLLLDAGAAINPATVIDKPLCRASREGAAAMLEFLIERGANIHANGEEALAAAIRHGHEEAAQLLLDRGASALDAWRKLWDEEQRAFLWSLDLAPEERAELEKSLAPEQRARL